MRRRTFHESLASRRRAKAFIGILVLLLAGCGIVAHDPRSTAQVEVVLQTRIGDIEIAVYVDKAPSSARAFLSLVDDGSFARYGTFYRAVRKNENDNGHPAIDVIEGGLQDTSHSLPGIDHETTAQSGLRHLNGTVSLARSAVGSATGAEFFICIGDQPALDFGGGRDPFHDGQGFAAFGQVTRGMEIVRMIHQLRTSDSARDPYLRGQMLSPPVRILKAFRKPRFTS